MGRGGEPTPEEGAHAATEGLEVKLAGKTVLCMPDLYIDELVSVGTWAEVQKQLASAALRGGGRIRTAGQRMVTGGNAFNAARALARLGVAARFAGVTSQAGLEFARRETAGEGLDLGFVRADGRPSLTVALEMGPDRTNVQLNDPGSLDGLRLADLGGGARGAFSGVSAVHVANWGQNVKAGTAFVVEALAAAREVGALTFFDPSDLWGREKDTLDLIRRVAEGKDLDYLLANEAEVRELARVLLLSAGGTSPCAHDDVEGQGREFSKRVAAGLAVHTAGRSESWRRGKSEGRFTSAPTAPSRVTGAGDCWNAAFIAATLAGLPPQVRLEFAHAAAFRFVTTAGPPPTLEEVRAVLGAAPRAPQ
jgi:sugar/nucleoside kinase (ribokinase family)